jgi:hypothetical protein
MSPLMQKRLSDMFAIAAYQSEFNITGTGFIKSNSHTLCCFSISSTSLRLNLLSNVTFVSFQ